MVVDKARRSDDADDGYPKTWYGLSGPRDWVIIHNHIHHDADTPHGLNGFRVWRSPHSQRHHAICGCGWRPDLGKHYKMRSPDEVRAHRV